MNMKVIFGGIALLVLLLIVAGCTQSATQQTTPAPTAAPTTEVPVTTAAATAVLTTFVPVTPGPTETLPSAQAVDVQVASNGESINPQVILTFRGGKGMNVIPEIDITLTRSDGTVESDKMVQPLYIGKTVSLAGSTGNKDRAEVWVYTTQGDKVKIIDQYVPFRSYN
jgi:ABC-type transport system substrate-binding protein